MRNQFSGFYDLSEKEDTKLFYEKSAEGIIAYEMEGIRGTDQWEKVVVIFHVSQEPTEFVLGTLDIKGLYHHQALIYREYI